jgi:DNA polymerase-3 subunit delta
MQVRPNQFDSHLANKALPAIILLFGDEPQQKLDVLDAIRAKAKQSGFEERQSLTADGDFSWHQLIDATQTMSLFSDKQYIELTLPTGKPGAQGAAILTEIAQNTSDDVLLLIQGPKIGKDVQNAKWFKQLLNNAWFCHCYELQGNQLGQWIKQRAQTLNVPLNSDGCAVIADMSEGNLLAANQEILKLALIYPNETVLDQQKVSAAVIDQSRYTVFQFTDEVLAANMSKAMKMLYRLESEGIEPNIVLWSLIKEAQLLEQCLTYHQRSEQIPYAKLRIWQNKQSLYNSALMRLSGAHIAILIEHLQKADSMLKSESVDKPFVLISHLALLFLPAPIEQYSLTTY